MINKYLIRLGILFVFITAYVPGAEAQIVDCAVSHTSGVFQVYLDQLYATSGSIGSDRELSDLMKQLEFKLGSFLEGVVTEVDGNSPCILHFCEGRKPRNVSEFSQSLVNRMHDEDVILEIWGALDKKTESTGLQVNHANIYYLLVPVWTETQGQPQLPGIQIVEYAAGGSTGDATHLDLLADTPEMRIFVEAGVGINNLLNKKYDAARTSVCAALTHFQTYLASKGGAPTLKEQALMNYLRSVAGKTISQAKVDPNYEGALTLLDENTDCCCEPEGGKQ